MKKIIISSALLLSIFVTGLTGCSSTSDKISDDLSDIEVVKWGDGDRPVYYQLDELEKASDLVVVGTLVEETEQRVDTEYNEHFKKDVVQWVNSSNLIKVSKVIKGDVNEGDTVKIQQGYAIVDKQLVTMSTLTPLVKGDTWVFFLSTANDCGYYWCTGDSDGRYPISTAQNQELAVSEYSRLGVYNRDDFKDDIYAEIVEKYGI